MLNVCMYSELHMGQWHFFLIWLCEELKSNNSHFVKVHIQVFLYTLVSLCRKDNTFYT